MIKSTDNGRLDPVLNRNETATLTAFVEGPDTTMDGAGLMAFPAFVDVHVHLRDPGFTEKETLENIEADIFVFSKVLARFATGCVAVIDVGA